jgi:hypothetical protein
MEVQQKLKKELPRKEITKECSISWVSSLTTVLEEAQEFAKEWGKTIDDVTMHHSYYDDYGSTSSEVHLEVEGLETDEEYHGRLWETHDNAIKREERERQEFERLRAKFTK